MPLFDRKKKPTKEGWHVSSPKTKSILLYLFFVLISAVFWGGVTFNQNVQQDMAIPLEITNIPENVTMISTPPTTITITVKDKGSSFLKYLLKPLPKVKINFSDYSDLNSGMLRVNSIRLRSAIKRAFDREATITSVLPDHLDLKFTSLPGKKVPIRYDMDIEPNIKYVVNGPMETSQDSVLVFSDRETLAEINEVYTYHVQEIDLTDTLHRQVTIAPIVGARVEPRTISIMVPIEQLIKKRSTVHVSVRNQPEGVNVIVFPSSITASYLVPKSEYKNPTAPITAIVDYNGIDFRSKSNKVAVMVGEAPAVFKNIELQPDSVEYIIEK